MSVKVTDKTVEFELKATQKSNLFLREFAEQVATEARPNTPKKENRLAIDIIRQVLGLNGKIKWNKDYAQYQERGSRKDGSRPVRNYTTPGTGKNFAVNAINSVYQRQNQIMKKVGLI